MTSAKTLVISFVGMETQEVAVQPNVTVALRSDTELLDEVVVTAYGTAKRSSFTGSASVVSSEKLEKVQTSDPTSALNGRVAGVQFNAASGQPGDLNNQDIESMTVLKDAASNALYGARGANGVIMITTKKGSSGQATVTVSDYERLTGRLKAD